MSAQPDPHADLGVPPDATAAEVHRAFRRRLREHHPDTRPQQDDAKDSASDQDLQRVLAAYETLRQRAASDGVEASSRDHPQRSDHPLSGATAATLGDPPLRATPVHWVPAAGTPPSHCARSERLDHTVPRLDAVVRWLRGDSPI